MWPQKLLTSRGRKYLTEASLMGGRRYERPSLTGRYTLETAASYRQVSYRQAPRRRAFHRRAPLIHDSIAAVTLPRKLPESKTLLTPYSV